jgi:hypothetical protein
MTMLAVHRLYQSPQPRLRVCQSVSSRHRMRLNQSLTPQRACFSLPRAQRGSVSERLAAVCSLSPGPRQDRCGGGVRWRGGQQGGRAIGGKGV